jgi:hypothetical protein
MSGKEKTELSKAVTLPDTKDRQTVVLSSGLIRGGNTITEVQVRTPLAGELRQLSLQSLANLEVDELITLLPRITSPTLTTQELSGLLPSDLLAMGLKVVAFLSGEKKEDTQTT